MSPLLISVPPSKSETQRALVLAALGRAPCTLTRPLVCDDSLALRRGLCALGARVDDAGPHWRVTPPNRLVAPADPLSLDNAGTAVRFLTALAPLVQGAYAVDGNAAMRRRPMPGLLAALAALGVRVEELGRPGCPPVRLTSAGGADTGAPARDPAPRAAAPQVTLSAGGSSQELSGLLLAGCAMPRGLVITVDGELPSRPYVEVTLASMAQAGVLVARPAPNTFNVPPQRPAANRLDIDGDWSSASYPLAAGWLLGREVTLAGLRPGSAQGDRVIVDLLPALARPGPRAFSMTDCPDLVPTVVACALFADGPTAITGVAHLRLKETDRLEALATELAKLGARVGAGADGLAVEPAPLHGAVLDPCDDHRLAMAFGLVSLRVHGVTIRDPDCVAKSYPDFWEMLAGFGPAPR